MHGEGRAAGPAVYDRADDSEGEFFGEERLYALLPHLRGLPAEEAGLRLVASVDRFVGEARTSDDLSLVLLQRL